MSVINTTKKVLIKRGMTPQEATLMVNDAIHANGPEIMDVADKLTDALKLAELRVTGATRNRIASELAYSNLANGKVFQQLVDDAILTGKLRPGMENFDGINEPLMRSIIAASASSAGKGLGHEADSLLMQPLSYVNKQAAEQVKEGRKKEGTQAIVNAEIMRAGLTALTRFRGGSLRWFMLGLQKASGLMLAETLIEESVRTLTSKAITGQKRTGGFYDMKFGNVDTESDNAELMTKSVSRYQSSRRRLARETANILLSYTIGYQILLPWLLQHFRDVAGAERTIRKQ